MVKTALELAKDTIDILNEKGWKQGPSNGYEDPSLCLGEAIGVASRRAINKNQKESDQQDIEIEKLRLIIEAHIPLFYPDDHTWCNLIKWNDTEGRTKQEVMDVLDKAVDVLIPAVS